MSLKNIILITGNELRHDFFRKYIASSTSISVLKSYCEVPENNLIENIQFEETHSLRSKHLLLRQQTECDFFYLFCDKVTDNSNPKFISKGLINSNLIVKEINDLNPDLIISYGCSIIKSTLINDFKGRFINIHLGLSPYYKGTATNFFPIINNEMSCIGGTFMFIDQGIDTGKIIHQLRPTISIEDNIHQIGNRLIAELVVVCEKLIVNFEKLVKEDIKYVNHIKGKIYRKKDFTEEAVAIMYENFGSGIVEKYINNKEQLDKIIPIISNPKLV